MNLLVDTFTFTERTYSNTVAPNSFSFERRRKVMATSIPCIQGKMGSVEYYLTTMKAGDAVSKIRIAKELPNWEGMTIEERMQRDINWKRVENEIARYLAEDDDRFFGALLVAMYNGS